MSASVSSALGGPAGYLALAALVAAEDSGVPVPGETALLAAAVLAHQGHLSIGLVIAVGAAGAMVGDNLGYLVGRKGARRLLERPGRWQDQRLALLRRGDRFFARHGPKAVFLGRFVTGARVAVAWLAGADRMPWPRFLAWNAAGAAAWAATVGLVGYLAGAGGASLAGTLGVGALIAVVAGAAVGLAVVRRRRVGPSD
jgi:undecaprenyl-diphosphatase